MINSADQLKNWATARRFITGGMPAKSPTIDESMVDLPERAKLMPRMLATP
jgi:hypothetical protein